MRGGLEKRWTRDSMALHRNKLSFIYRRLVTLIGFTKGDEMQKLPKRVRTRCSWIYYDARTLLKKTNAVRFSHFQGFSDMPEILASNPFLVSHLAFWVLLLQDSIYLN